MRKNFSRGFSLPLVVVGKWKSGKKPLPEISTYGWSVINESDTIVDNRYAIRYTLIGGKNSGFPEGSRVEHVGVEKNGVYYSIVLGNYDYLETFNQILSTFQFLD